MNIDENCGGRNRVVCWLVVVIGDENCVFEEVG